MKMKFIAVRMALCLAFIGAVRIVDYTAQVYGYAQSWKDTCVARYEKDHPRWNRRDIEATCARDE